VSDMTKKYDGGPAFPVETTATPYAPGMSLRDWFAGQALVSMGDRQWNGDHSGTGTEKQARAAYRIADAMIAECDK